MRLFSFVPPPFPGDTGTEWRTKTQLSQKDNSFLPGARLRFFWRLEWNQNMDNSQHLLTPEEAAAFLRISPVTLRKMRGKGTGPASCRLGHRTVRYPREGLLKWLARATKGAL